jgi:hypothetical protein
MKALLFLLPMILSLATRSVAQGTDHAAPYYIGHSLINFDVPRMVNGLAEDADKTHDYDLQIINGAPLQWQYNHPENAQGTPYTWALTTGKHDVMVITEAIPLQNHLTWSETHRYSRQFLEYALEHRQGEPLRFYLFETWHCIHSGTTGCEWDNGDSLLWHPRLVADFPLWTGIVNHLRQSHPDQEIWMVPGGQAFHMLEEEIQAGRVPGISSYQDLFSDDIHLRPAGNYFMACLMYSCIYRSSPEGLAHGLTNTWGTPYPDMPTADQARVFQKIAWDTALRLSVWTGVEEVNRLSPATRHSLSASVQTAPNPARDFTTLEWTQTLAAPVRIHLLDATGRQLESLEAGYRTPGPQTWTLDLSNYPPGLYFVQVQSDQALITGKCIRQ